MQEEKEEEEEEEEEEEDKEEVEDDEEEEEELQSRGQNGQLSDEDQTQPKITHHYNLRNRL